MKHIIVVGDTSSTNLGDPILTNSCAHIVRQTNAGRDAVVDVFDIAGRMPQKSIKAEKPAPISLKKHPSRVKDKLQILLGDIKTVIQWHLTGKKRFLERLSKYDLKEAIFIIAGGALISYSPFYALRINLIVKVAKKYCGKVIFNAVGIEKTVRNPGIAKYIIRHYLKNEKIVAFSTRDNIDEIPYLTSRKEFYLQTSDAGIFAGEAYGISRANSNTVGLSVISFNAYRSIVQNDKRAKDISPESLLEFWESIIQQLQNANKPFKILTNGGPADFDMALRLVERLNLDKTHYLLPMAQDSEELIAQIAQFSFLIAHRLHACIISTSLGIPCMPVIWSNKITAFASMTNNQNAIWPCPEMDVINTIENSKVDRTRIDQLKQMCLDYINSSLECC